MMRQILSIIAFAVLALCLAVAGVIFAPGPIHAQGNDNDYVDVGVTLEVPRNIDLLPSIIVVNRGARTAYDVEVVVSIESPALSYFYDTSVTPPIGSSSLESSRSLRWSIPALEGGRREEYPVLVITVSDDPDFDNSRHPHEFLGRVTTSSFESGLHQRNNTSRVWSYSSSNAGQQWQAAGNYSVVVSVDDPSPAPGDIVNFTVTTDRERRDKDYLAAPPIDMEVAIELTGGLSVSGAPTYASGYEGGLTVPDSVSYSNGVFRVGTLKGGTLTESGDPIQNSVTLPVRVANNAVVNEQCLTATLTGNPPPGTGRYDDKISDNVAKLCLGAQPADPITRGEVDVFTVYDCFAREIAPCDGTDGVRVRAVDKNIGSGVIRASGTVLVQIRDRPGRTYDGHTKNNVLQSVNDSNTVSWQTATDRHDDFIGTREGVTIFFSRMPFNSHLNNWIKVAGEHIKVTGPNGSDPPGTMHIRTASSGSALSRMNQGNGWIATYSGTSSKIDVPIPSPWFAEFSELGTYVVEYTTIADRDNANGDCASQYLPSGVTAAYCDTETYTFHIGPIAELEVRDGGASSHVAADRNALKIVAVNNGPDEPSGGARVTGLPTGAELLHISHGNYNRTAGEWNIGELRGRDYYRSRGESEPTLVLGASAGDTASVSISSVKDYEVCIGSDASTLSHTTRATCVADTANGGSWHTTPVYDHIADNNTVTLEARAGTGEGRPGAPAASQSPRSVPAAIVVQWADLETLNGWPVSHYEVQRSSSQWEMVANHVECATEVELPCRYVDTDAEPGQSYSYRVRAVNLPGVEGPWSRPMAFGGAPTPGVPEAPVLTAEASGYAEIELTWEKPGEGGSLITGYTLQVADSRNGLDSPDRDRELTLGPGVTSWTHEDLLGGTTKYYRLRAVNDEGHSDWSDVVSATTVAQKAPGAPAGVVARGASGADACCKIIVTWQPPADGGGTPLTDYEVQWSPNGTSGWRAAGQVGADTPSFEDTGLTWGTTRWYRVAARNVRGLSAWSDPPAPGATAAQDQTQGVTVPKRPTNLELFPGNAQMTVTWDAPDDGRSPIRGYKVMYRHRDPDRGTTGAWQAWQELSHFPTEPRVTMHGMYNYVEYQVKVAAVNGVGASQYSEVKTGIYAPRYVPSEPPNVEFQPGDRRIKVTWREPWDLGYPALTGYRVQWRKDAGDTDWPDPTTSGTDRDTIDNISKTSTSVTITGLENGVTYQVRVWAVNDAGDSPKAGEDGKLKATPKAP